MMLGKNSVKALDGGLNTAFSPEFEQLEDWYSSSQ
jgi:hypothetical protein